MITPNFIPRTLRGVGGVRLYDIPGVIYPKDMLVAPKGTRLANGKPFTEPPSWGITTEEAAKLLSCTPAAARLSLQRRKVRSCRVMEPHAVLRLYWDRREVEDLARERLPIVTRIPAKMMSSDEAVKCLHTSRSTLYRYVRRKLLKEYQVRLMTPAGTRKVSYYLKAEVRKLASHLRAVQLLEAQAAELRRKLRG